MRYAGEGQDPYCYPGTDVLKNLPGFQDGETLQKFETEISQWEQARIELTPVEGKFDLSHLREIHRHLFHQVYDWARHIRTGDIRKDETLFAHHVFIESYGTEVLSKLAKERERWKPGQPPEDFINRLAEYFGEINALHPFREGNGRVQRIFIAQLAQEYGLQIDWSKTTPEEMIHASRLAMIGDNSSLAAILGKCSDILESPKTPTRHRRSPKYGDIE